MKTGTASAPIDDGNASMATLIPSLNGCLSRMTGGEKRFARLLEAKLEDDYLCWYVTGHSRPSLLALVSPRIKIPVKPSPKAAIRLSETMLRPIMMAPGIC